MKTSASAVSAASTSARTENTSPAKRAALASPLVSTSLAKIGTKAVIEGAFGKEPPEQVREAQGGVEGVCHGAGAKHRGDHRLADEAQHAAGRGRATDTEKLAEQAHGLSGPFRAREACTDLHHRIVVGAPHQHIGEDLADALLPAGKR